MNVTKTLNIKAMQFFKLLSVLFILLAFNLTASAQIFASSSSGLLAYSTVNESPSTDSWSFYSDEENKMFYIDFETISINLSSIKIKTPTGKVIFEDVVSDLPVNTIYELDYNNFEKGKYFVELHAYSKIITKEIELK